MYTFNAICVDFFGCIIFSNFLKKGRKKVEQEKQECLVSIDRVRQLDDRFNKKIEQIDFTLPSCV